MCPVGNSFDKMHMSVVHGSRSLRVHFQEKLEEIQSDVVRMGGEASEMVRIAMEAALSGDLDAASRVVGLDDRIDSFDRDVLNKSVIAVMQESPVANDLRFLISTMGIVGEIEKVGDDAVKLARRARKLHGQFPAEMKAALIELGELARHSFASSIRLYCDYSPELAREIIKGDQEVDTAYSNARNRVFEMIKQNPENTEHLVRTIEVFHALEHVADHAVAIATRLSMLHNPQ
jgi:phosphate transport system protein